LAWVNGLANGEVSVDFQTDACSFDNSLHPSGTLSMHVTTATTYLCRHFRFIRSPHGGISISQLPSLSIA
jgi:hypothetical protein